MLKIREIEAKSVLTKSNLPEADFVINPYVGCMHGCAYCYAVFMKRFSKHKEEWGHFVDVKVNAPEILEKELKSVKKGTVLLSSVTDAYLPLERKCKLTRKILKLLADSNLEASILTKSDLVLRDIDLLKQMKGVEVGFSFMSFNDAHRKLFEPLTVSPQRRLKAMKTLVENGIRVYAFIGPIFPYLTNLEEMFSEFSKIKAGFVYCENLNNRTANWGKTLEIIKREFPELLEKYNEIFSSKNNYWIETKKQIRALSKKHDLKAKVYFH